MKKLSVLAMATAATFVVLLVALHVVRADLAPSWHMISEYALGPWGWLMSAAFLVLAAAFVSLMLAFVPGAQGWLGWTGVAMLALAGIGAAMGGLFPTDPVGTPAAQATRSGALHGLAFLIGVPGALLGVTFTTFRLWHDTGWKHDRRLLLWTATMVWVTMIIFGVSMATLIGKGATGPEFLVGWQNRALVLSWAVWIFAIARQLCRRRKLS